MSHDGSVLVRSVRTAVRIPGAEAPYDTAHLVVRYPALPAQDTAERMSGQLRPDPAGAPYPIVVLVPGVNCASESYSWLARRLVGDGFVVVGFDWVGMLFPGQYGLTPGVDLDAVTPEGYGSGPTTQALRPVLDAVAGLAADGPLAGLLDLGRVALVGHSAGGTVALQSARPAWFPEVRAVVTYGAHTMASQLLGYPPSTLLPAPVEAPVLIAAGTADGVVAASAVRYGEEAGAPGHDPVERTFAEALPEGTEAWLLRLADAGHMLLAHPDDPSTARGFLEEPTDADADRLRAVLADTISLFLNAHLAGRTDAKASLDELLAHPMPEIADIRRR